MAARLSIAESFYSIQGEGQFAGTPAVFIRLAGCNLSCGGVRTIQTGELDSGATWRCDTIEVWTRGGATTGEALLENIAQRGWLHRLKDGAHLVITGGEPLLQSEAVSRLLEALPIQPFVEVETNGTILPAPILDEFVSSYNVSPKLSNSGMSEQQRLIPDALRWFAGSPKTRFKFVVTCAEDWEELERQILLPYSISAKKVWLMAGADSQAALHRIGPVVAELALQRGVHYSPRLHIELWDQKTGV